MFLKEQVLEMVSGQYTCSVYLKQVLEMVSGQYTCSVYLKQVLEIISGQCTCSVYLKQVLEMVSRQYTCSVYLKQVTGESVGILLCHAPALQAVEEREENPALVDYEHSLSGSHRGPPQGLCFVVC